MNLPKAAATLGVGGLVLGLLGTGIGASFTDSATAVQNINVGTFSCQVSSTDSHAVVNGNSVTINLPDILSSASSNYLMDVSVKNTGSMPAVVHWSAVTGGTIAWQPAGRMGYAMGTSGDPMTTGLTLAPGVQHTYAGAIGFMWATLTNDDFGKSAQVTYKATCGEVPPPPPPPTSKVSFVGVANEGGSAVASKNTGALALPAGSTVGDIAIVMTYGATGGNNAQTPAGYTQIQTSGAGNMQSVLSYRILVAGDTSVPSQSTGYGVEVAVYRGVAGIGSHTSIGGNLNNVSGSAYPLRCIGLDGVNGPAMTKTDGSSWVACLGGDGFATTNAKSMVFVPFTYGTPPNCFPGGCTYGAANTTNRSSGNSVAFTGLADTNGGVTAWGPLEGWSGDNFSPMPGSHGVVVHSIELLSK